MPEAPLEAYLTTTNDGQAVNIQGLCGGRISVFDPSTGSFGIEQLPATLFLQNCFDGSAWVEDPTTGVISPSRSLVSGSTYYVGLKKPGAASPLDVAFWTSGFVDPSKRYRFNGDGIPVYTDPAGTKCTLVGMVHPVNGSVLSLLAGPNGRAITSTQPWARPQAQALPVNSGDYGQTIDGQTPINVIPQANIIACGWAWRGVKSKWSGRVANGSGTAFGTLFMQPFARGLSTGTFNYGQTLIHQITGAGVNTTLCFDGVSLAINDDAFEFGLNAWVNGSAMYLDLTQVVDAYL